MTIQVAHALPERQLPPHVRELFHKKLDEILGTYEYGGPLGIRANCAFSSDRQSLQLDLILREWV